MNIQRLEEKFSLVNRSELSKQNVQGTANYCCKVLQRQANFELVKSIWLQKFIFV